MGTKGMNMPKIDDEPTTASFHFREKGKVQPKGYKGLQVDTEATVTVRGKIKQIGSTWDDSKTFTIEVASCEIEPAAACAMSLEAALKDAEGKRKRVV